MLLQKGFRISVYHWAAGYSGIFLNLMISRLVYRLKKKSPVQLLPLTGKTNHFTG